MIWNMSGLLHSKKTHSALGVLKIQDLKEFRFSYLCDMCWWEQGGEATDHKMHTKNKDMKLPLHTLVCPYFPSRSSCWQTLAKTGTRPSGDATHWTTLGLFWLGLKALASRPPEISFAVRNDPCNGWLERQVAGRNTEGTRLGDPVAARHSIPAFFRPGHSSGRAAKGAASRWPGLAAESKAGRRSGETT